MAPGRKSFRSALFASAVFGLALAPVLMTAGCSSNGDDDRREWRDDRRDRESREERRERKKLERVLEQQKQ